MLLDHKLLKGKTIVQKINPETNEVIEEYFSCRKASKTQYSNISNACYNGNIVDGYKWRYLKIE